MPVVAVVTAVLMGLVVAAVLFIDSDEPGAENEVSVKVLDESEYGVVYLEAHRVFVVASDDGPVALSDDAQHVPGDFVRYCPLSETFVGLHGGLFDRLGRYIDGPPNRDMDQVTVEVTGEMIVVHVDQVVPSVGRSPSPDGRKGPHCEDLSDDPGFFRPQPVTTIPDE